MVGTENKCENLADQIDYNSVYHLTQNVMQLLKVFVLFKWKVFLPAVENHSFLSFILLRLVLNYKMLSNEKFVFVVILIMEKATNKNGDIVNCL